MAKCFRQIMIAKEVKVNALNYLWFYSGNCLEVLKIPRKSSARIAGLWADI
jgi:hypothetical protein